MMKLISLDNVSVCYDGKKVVSGATFDVNTNDFIGIIGPNGGGKTSLIKAMLNLVPYSGIIEKFEGLSIENGGIGYLPQQNNIDRSFPITVYEIILSGLQSKNKLLLKSTTALKKAIEGLMDIARIKDLSNKNINELSGGQFQRVLLCRALISEPKLLILDEPANFIDNKFESELYDILLTLNQSTAIIMVSHEIDAISSFVKSVVCVNKTVHKHEATGELATEIHTSYQCPLK